MICTSFFPREIVSLRGGHSPGLHLQVGDADSAPRAVPVARLAAAGYAESGIREIAGLPETGRYAERHSCSRAMRPAPVQPARQMIQQEPQATDDENRRHQIRISQTVARIENEITESR